MKKVLAGLVFCFSIVLIAQGQPVNDDCTGAIIVTIPASGNICVTGSTVNATSTNWVTSPCGANTWTDDVWYSFTSTGTINTITVQPSGAPTARKLGVSVFQSFDGLCDSIYTPNASSCSVAATNNATVSVQEVAPAGTQYWVEISGFNRDGGFQLCVTSATPPPSPGTSCDSATPICSLDPFTLSQTPLGTQTITPPCFTAAGVSQPANASVWYKFTVGVTGQLSWECTPPALSFTELDWALYDITANGCAGVNDATVPDRCNFHYGQSLSEPIGMSDTSTTNCPIVSGADNNPWGEFCPSMTVTAGSTYVILINNFSNDQAGWDFNFNGSTFKMAPAATITVSPDTICGNSGTVNIVNSSVGVNWQTWNFGDGSAVDTTFSPGSHTYGQPGSYVISLKDSTSEGCTNVYTGSVLVSPYPTVVINALTNCTGTQDTLTATPSVPGGTYSWSPGGATTQSIIVSPGATTTYTVTYTSPTGCSATATQLITISAAGTASINPATASVCLGQNTTLTASNGLGYLWSNGATTQSITVSPAGTTTYTVTVTIAGGCTATASATVTIAAVPVVAINPPAATICSGQSATLTATAGANSYTWSDAETTNVITVFPTSNATYTVTASNGGTCTATASANVTVGAAIAPNVTPVTQTICNGQNTTLTASGGTGYTWSTAATTAAITVTPAATVTYYVTISNGICSVVDSAIVTVDNPSANINPANISICAGQSTTLTATGGGTYSWSDAETTAAITVSPAANITYTVTTTDAATCTATAQSVVTVNPLPIVFIAPTGDTICPGQISSLTATGGTIYRWSNGGTFSTINVSPLATTTYTVTVTDVNHCTATNSAVVTFSPPFTIAPTITNVSCFGDSDGAVNLVVNGTTPPYTYAWGVPLGGTNPSINNLLAGSYAVTVTDANRCTLTQTESVTQPPILRTGNAVVGNIGCDGGNTGFVTANPVGGTPAYTYAWSSQSTGQTYSSQGLGGLAAGAYDLTITDSHFCSVTTTYQIAAIPVLTFTFTSSNINCYGAQNGTASVTITSGTPPFQYVWAGNGTPNGASYVGIAPGPISVVVTDSNNCTCSSCNYRAEITQPQQIFIENIAVNNTGCNGGADGSIQVLVYGGTNPLSLVWSNGPINTSNITALPAGVYTLTVTDSNFCTASLTDTINQPAIVSLTIDSNKTRCYDGADGYAVGHATGGTPDYTYNWSSGATGDTALFLAIGTYFCTVSDANQCTATATTSIGQPSEIYIDPTGYSVKCPGQKNGSISVADTGGVAPYNYAVTTDGVNFIYATDSLIIGLDTGWYSVLVSDNNGCTRQSTVFVPNAILDMDSATTDSTLCYGPDYKDGAIHIKVGPFINAPFQFSLDSELFQSSGNFWGVSAGRHTVIVINGNGCQDTIPVIVYEPLPIVASITPDTLELEPGENRQVLVSYLNTSDPSYSWTPAPGLSCIDCPNPVVNTYAPGMYTVTVSKVEDSATCYGSATLWVNIKSHPPVFVPDAFSPNNDGNNDVFTVYGDEIKLIDMKIFNRWGELIYQTSSQFAGWDGTYKGHLQMPGVFTYEVSITFLDNSQLQKSGGFTLVR